MSRLTRCSLVALVALLLTATLPPPLTVRLQARAINDNLTAYWGLEEADGSTRFDSTPTAANLTQNGTPLNNAAGIISTGNALDSEFSTTAWVGRADNDAVSGCDCDLTVVAWVKAETFGTTGIVNKWNSTGNQRGYILYYDNAVTRFTWGVSSDGTSTNSTLRTAASLGTGTVGVEYMIIADHDATANEIGISINNGTRDSVGHAAGIFNDTTAFTLGALAGGVNIWDGLIDEVMLYKRLLTPAEKACLYNAGDGRTYAGLSACDAASTGPKGGQILRGIGASLLRWMGLAPITPEWRGAYAW